MKAITFHTDENLHSRLKMAVAYDKTTIKKVLNMLIKTYVQKTEKRRLNDSKGV